jgi:hypothetical protein
MRFVHTAADHIAEFVSVDSAVPNRSLNPNSPVALCKSALIDRSAELDGLAVLGKVVELGKGFVLGCLRGQARPDSVVEAVVPARTAADYTSDN